MRENLVVHFDDERFISADKIVVKNKEGVVELQSSQNFHEEKRDNKLVIKVCKEVAQNMQELIVTLCTCDKSTTYVSITGTFCCQNIMCYSQRNNSSIKDSRVQKFLYSTLFLLIQPVYFLIF